MAHAFPGALRRSLIATAAVVLLGTVGATCGVVVRGPADALPATGASEGPPVAVLAPAIVVDRSSSPWRQNASPSSSR